jgi:hypothetical protein
VWNVNTLPYNERIEILAASIDARIDACRMMVAAAQNEDAALYDKGRKLHTYAENWARKARCN